MPFRRVPAALLLLCLIPLGLSSCLVRRRAIRRKGAGAVKNPNLLVANRETLVNEVARQYEAIHDFTATVDMIPALGTAEKSKITEYKDVRALHHLPQARRHPDHRALPGGAQQRLRHGLQRPRFQAVRARRATASSRAATRSIKPSQNKLENLRPHAFPGRDDGAAGRAGRRKAAARELHRRGQRLLHPARRARDRAGRTAARRAPSGSAASTCNWRGR